MLFPINPQTPQCQVFKVLNDELLYFLKASITATGFNETLFNAGADTDTDAVCWENLKTQEKFRTLWDTMVIEKTDRAALYNMINDAQDIPVFFSDTTLELPEIANPKVFNALKALTSHLFASSKTLVVIETLAGETINKHYQNFTDKNKFLCTLCGTTLLSQNRTGYDDDDQWRADYDHILCKDKYPEFAAHPANFIPTCNVCNSKAKGARNLLKDDKNRRRKAFYPLPPQSESCYQHIKVKPTLGSGRDITPLTAISIIYPTASTVELEKIHIWEEVYQVPSRVSANLLSNFIERIAADCTPDNFAEFKQQIEKKSRKLPEDYRMSEWRFWWYSLYHWLHEQPEQVKQEIWGIIKPKQEIVNQNNDARSTYGH
ncbi:MAG: hypothetical protein ACI8WB_006106 [Phenylobacterium sp.]|jgi:hypothetical protein